MIGWSILGERPLCLLGEGVLLSRGQGGGDGWVLSIHVIDSRLIIVGNAIDRDFMRDVLCYATLCYAMRERQEMYFF